MNFPKLTQKEYEILDLLRAGNEMFGLEMVKASKGELKRGTIYVTLKRMSDKGFVDSRKEDRPADPGMPLRLYKITGKGASVLNVYDAAKASMAGAQTAGDSYA